MQNLPSFADLGWRKYIIEHTNFWALVYLACILLKAIIYLIVSHLYGLPNVALLFKRTTSIAEPLTK